MKIKYDPTSDVMYFEFEDTTVTTKRVTNDIAIDYDADGKVAGVEVLGAKNTFSLEQRIFQSNSRAFCGLLRRPSVL